MRKTLQPFQLRDFLFLVILAAIGLMPACATIEDNPRTTDLIVSYAVAKVIYESGDPEHRAQRITDVATTALEAASDQGVLVAIVEQEVRRAINWSSLPPPDFVLVDQLIDIVAEELRERVGDGRIDPEDLESATTILQAVIDAAAPYLDG